MSELPILTDEQVTDLFFPRGTEAKIPEYVMQWIRVGKITAESERSLCQPIVDKLEEENKRLKIDADRLKVAQSEIIRLEQELALRVRAETAGTERKRILGYLEEILTLSEKVKETAIKVRMKDIVIALQSPQPELINGQTLNHVGNEDNEAKT
jgi:hypothetical protein